MPFTTMLSLLVIYSVIWFRSSKSAPSNQRNLKFLLVSKIETLSNRLDFSKLKKTYKSLQGLWHGIRRWSWRTFWHQERFLHGQLSRMHQRGAKIEGSPKKLLTTLTTENFNKSEIIRAGLGPSPATIAPKIYKQ